MSTAIAAPHPVLHDPAPHARREQHSNLSNPSTQQTCENPMYSHGSLVPAGLPSIGLDQLNQCAELQTRVDRKYILKRGQALPLLAQLADGATSHTDPAQAANSQVKVLEIDGIRNQRYRSLYFDTPEATSYRMAATGRRRRFKIRTRVYQDTRQAFLELKVRGARGTTVKDRVEIPVDVAMNDQISVDGWEWIEHSLRATGMEHIVPQLQPSLWGTYRRTTLLVPGGRVTVDTDLAWRNNTSHQHTFPQMVIVETKSDGSATSFDRSLWTAGIRPAKISKFGTGMAALDRTLPSHKWHRTLKQHFVFSTVTRP